jgi:hypothetical protein
VWRLVNGGDTGRAGSDPLACVEVLRFGTTRPARVRVRFVDDAFEGRKDWVPPARLKVPWAERERWLACEARWCRVQGDLAETQETPERRAALHVLDREPNVAIQRYTPLIASLRRRCSADLPN